VQPELSSHLYYLTSTLLVYLIHNTAFFTSDFPVAYEEAEDKNLVNKIVPLTPKLAVRLQPLRHSPRGEQATIEFRHFTSRRHHLSRKEAIETNRLLVRSAEDAVFYRDDLPWVLGFIKKNRNFRVDTEIFQFSRGNAVFQQARQGIVPFQQPDENS
jgi:hypothetical protein